MLRKLHPYAGLEHQPFNLGPGPGSGGVLLLHGFTGTPAEVRGLGQSLADRGWHARGVLLPGFGPDIANLHLRRGADWLAEAGKAWEDIYRQRRPRFLFGYSLGGAIALHLAHSHPPEALVLAAPFWHIPGFLPRLVPIGRWLGLRWRPLEKADFSEPILRQQIKSILPSADLDSLEMQDSLRREYTLPLSAIHEAMVLGRSAFQKAAKIRVPVLLIQGENDPLVQPAQTKRLAARLVSRHVRYHTLSAGHELLTPGSPQLAQCEELILDFFERFR